MRYRYTIQLEKVSRPALSSIQASSTCRPPGVKDGVAELVGANPKLEKVIILTEKVSQKGFGDDTRHMPDKRRGRLRGKLPRSGGRLE